MTVGKAADTCFNALKPRNAVSPQRTAHRNALAPLLPYHASRAAVGKPARGALAPLAVSTSKLL
ncbi:hypothetical protein LC593_26825 [Nostoc sp. CHAB 5844]|nr:hypothetical protein [Nostoc sp. CHAB 5844]